MRLQEYSIYCLVHIGLTIHHDYIYIEENTRVINPRAHMRSKGYSSCIIHVLMRDEKEARKKEARRKQGQTHVGT